MPHRSATGITINEPDPLHARTSYRFREAALDAYIDGKGKKKIDDMSNDPFIGCRASTSTSVAFNEDVAAVGSSIVDAAGSDGSYIDATGDTYVLAAGASTSRGHVPATTYGGPTDTGAMNLRMNIHSAASMSSSQGQRTVSCGCFGATASRRGRQPRPAPDRWPVVFLESWSRHGVHKD